MINNTNNSYNLRSKTKNSSFENNIKNNINNNITPPVILYPPKTPKIEPIKLTPIQKNNLMDNKIENDSFQLNESSVSTFSLYIDENGNEFGGYIQLDSDKKLSLIDDYDYDNNNNNNEESKLIIPWKTN